MCPVVEFLWGKGEREMNSLLCFSNIYPARPNAVIWLFPWCLCVLSSCSAFQKRNLHALLLAVACNRKLNQPRMGGRSVAIAWWWREPFNWRVGSSFSHFLSLCCTHVLCTASKREKAHVLLLWMKTCVLISFNEVKWNEMKLLVMCSYISQK